MDKISTGGFNLDVAYTPTALRELAKMDGAIIVDPDSNRIVRAGVHLMPDPTIDTVETGTRHRTAERVARQTGLPALSVSASMATITLYLDSHRHLVERSEQILSRAGQALQTLERYRARLREVTNRLSALEVQDQVTVRDFAVVAQRLEMIRRLGSSSTYVVELGTDGRMLTLQLHELGGGVDRAAAAAGAGLPAGRPAERPTAAQRPAPAERRRRHDSARAAASTPRSCSSRCPWPGRRLHPAEHLDTRISTRGYRQVAQINRLPTVRPSADRALRQPAGVVRGQLGRAAGDRRGRREPGPDHPRRPGPAGRIRLHRTDGLTVRRRPVQERVS